ncbi:MAG: hypothetical protein U5K37_04360 [Natrialbaceae archaeon]|nr:hypothetical protein [Natrialbaceae archaeon]
MYTTIAQMGVPGGPELLIILFILAIPLAVGAALIFILVAVTRRKSSAEEQIEELEQRVRDLEDRN